MTQEEKAKELCKKFQVLFGFDERSYKLAKACAIIAVDEIIGDLSEIYQSLSHNPYSKEVVSECANYWNQVKAEIEKQ